MANSNDHAISLTSPSFSVSVVVPHDANPLPVLPEALYIDDGGHVTLRCVDDGADLVFRNVPVGAISRAFRLRQMQQRVCRRADQRLLRGVVR